MKAQISFSAAETKKKLHSDHLSINYIKINTPLSKKILTASISNFVTEF